MKLDRISKDCHKLVLGYWENLCEDDLVTQSRKYRVKRQETSEDEEAEDSSPSSRVYVPIVLRQQVIIPRQGLIGNNNLMRESPKCQLQKKTASSLVGSRN